MRQMSENSKNDKKDKNKALRHKKTITHILRIIFIFVKINSTHFT